MSMSGVEKVIFSGTSIDFPRGFRILFSRAPFFPKKLYIDIV